MATSILTPPAVSTAYLVRELKAARGWQHRAIAEAVEASPDVVALWTSTDLDALQPDHRRRVETILSTASTLPWWTRGWHD